MEKILNLLEINVMIEDALEKRDRTWVELLIIPLMLMGQIVSKHDENCLKLLVV